MIVKFKRAGLAVSFVCMFTCSNTFGQDNIFPSSGNVGIGGVDPSEKLEVFNGFMKSGHVSIGSSNELSPIGPLNYINLVSDSHASLLLGQNLTIYTPDRTRLRIAKSHGTMGGSGILMPGNNQVSQGSIIFYTSEPAPTIAGQQFDSSRMIIAGNGNVGIGTMSPEDLLSVNGRVRAREIKVNSQNWPDYVFSKDYKMVSLEELSSFIDRYKHLPEVPSSMQVEAHGIELGKMNAILLKKIEELTLYVIDLKAEIETLKKR